MCPMGEQVLEEALNSTFAAMPKFPGRLQGLERTCLGKPDIDIDTDIYISIYTDRQMDR